jgi:hypothetical protein
MRRSPAGVGTCRRPQELDVLPFQIDHVRPIKHGGPTSLDNLALSCLTCNARKGPNLSGIDRQTNAVVPLFDPRTQVWVEHFCWQGPILIGLTPTGRATIQTLAINDLGRVEHRRLLIEAGHFPG